MSQEEEAVRKIDVIVVQEYITLLCSLLASFENFIVTIELREVLPTLDALDVNTIEESKHRMQNLSENNSQKVLLIKENKLGTRQL